MGRAHGKHTPRQPTYDPDTPEGREIGRTGRQEGPKSDIPGGINHLKNEPTVRQKVPITTPGIEYAGIMAHGVPPYPITTEDRATAERGGPNHVKTTPPKYQKLPDPVTPVPVFIVEEAGGENTFRSSAPHHFTVPANTSDPVRVCGRDLTRSRLLLLNEDTATNIRFAQTPGDLVAGGGALLPWPTNSYLTLQTQDEIWVLSAGTGTPLISVIQEFEREF